MFYEPLAIPPLPSHSKTCPAQLTVEPTGLASDGFSALKLFVLLFKQKSPFFMTKTYNSSAKIISTIVENMPKICFLTKIHVIVTKLYREIRAKGSETFLYSAKLSMTFQLLIEN